MRPASEEALGGTHGSCPRRASSALSPRSWASGGRNLCVTLCSSLGLCACVLIYKVNLVAMVQMT